MPKKQKDNSVESSENMKKNRKNNKQEKADIMVKHERKSTKKKEGENTVKTIDDITQDEVLQNNEYVGDINIVFLSKLESLINVNVSGNHLIEKDEVIVPRMLVHKLIAEIKSLNNQANWLSSALVAKNGKESPSIGAEIMKMRNKAVAEIVKK